MRNNCKTFIANTKSHCSFPDVTETPNSLSNHFAKCAILCLNVVGISAKSCELSNNLATSLAGGDWGIVALAIFTVFKLHGLPAIILRHLLGLTLSVACPSFAGGSTNSREQMCRGTVENPATCEQNTKDRGALDKRS